MKTQTPQWGHAILSPEGQEIRLPMVAIGRLQLLGLLLPNRNRGLLQLSPRIDAFLHPDYDSLMEGLRRMLGHELEGPEWVLCTCRQCHRLREDMDKTRAPRKPGQDDEAPRGKRPWLKVIRARHATAADRN